jgi:hypothetical protein
MRISVAALAGLLCGAISMPSHGQQATAAERYMLQERCGKQAAAEFEKNHVPSGISGGVHRTFNYENHYSQKLNKCFFLEIATFIENGVWSRQLRLFDLNENKEYGSYWHSDSRPNYMDCLVGEARCSSEKEWRELAKPYLED